MKQSFKLTLCHLIIIGGVWANPPVPSSAKSEASGKDNKGDEVEGRNGRSIDSIYDTLLSLESPSASSGGSQSQESSANSNSRPHNVPYPGRSAQQDPNQRQSGLFPSDKPSRGSGRSSFSSQNDPKRRNSERPKLLSHGHRRFDDNFPMIPFPYPPPFGAFPGFDESSNSKQSSSGAYPKPDPSGYGSKGGNKNIGIGNDVGKVGDFYGNKAFPNAKYTVMPKGDEAPRHHKDHEILRAAGYPSSRVFFPSHGMPAPQEINIPMFSYGHDRSSKDGSSGQQAKHSSTTTSTGDFDDTRGIEDILGLRRDSPAGSREDQGSGQLKTKPFGGYGQRLFPHGGDTEHRYGDSGAPLGTRYGDARSGLGNNLGYKYGEGQTTLATLADNSGQIYEDDHYNLVGDNHGQRYGNGQLNHESRYEDGQYKLGDIPDHRYGEVRSVYRENTGHRYGQGQAQEENSGHRYDDGELIHRPASLYNPGQDNRNPSNRRPYQDGQQLTNAALGNIGLGPSIFDGYQDDQSPNVAQGSLDNSGYEGYGAGVGAFAGGQTFGPAYPITSTNPIWRGYGQKSYVTDEDKAALTSANINAAALQALDGITSLNRDHSSHSSSYSSGIGGIGLGSSYNPYRALSSSYGGLFS